MKKFIILCSVVCIVFSGCGTTESSTTEATIASETVATTATAANGCEAYIVQAGGDGYSSGSQFEEQFGEWAQWYSFHSDSAEKTATITLQGKEITGNYQHSDHIAYFTYDSDTYY